MALQKTLFGGEIRSIIIDPSVVCSRVHVKALSQGNYRIFMPSTMVNLFSRGKARETLNYFSQAKFSPEAREFLNSVHPYQKRETLPKFKSWPTEVNRILEEEYSSLKENFLLLARNKYFLNYFQKCGVPLIEFSPESKEELLSQLLGMRKVVAFALPLHQFIKLSSDPEIKNLSLEEKVMVGVVDKKFTK